MSTTRSAISTVFALLFVIGCGISLFFVTMHEVSESTLVAAYKNYSSVAIFNPVQNATAILQDNSNFDRWAMVPGQFDSVSEVQVGIAQYSSSADTNITWQSNEYLGFNMTWNMAGASYDKVLYGCATCYRDVVTATPTWTIDMTEEVKTAFNQSF